MLEVRFLVESPENWVKSVANDSGTVRFMSVKASKGEDTQELVELSSEKLTPEELLSHLRKARGVVESDLSKIDKNRLIGAITTHDCAVCSTFADLNCFLVWASTRPDGRMEWKLLVSGEGELQRLCRRLEEKHVWYKILGITRRIAKREMTSRQEEILKIALDLGYLDFPKRITLAQLSEKLGITPGTLTEILRRAQKHIVSQHFSE